MRRAGLFLVAVAIAASASAQIRAPVILQRMIPALRPGQQPPAPVGIDALRADFLAHTGADTIFFGSDSVILGAPAKATLGAQAQWLLQHPGVVVRIEGHAEPNDTRDHALGAGARRAEEVRQYRILLGVPATQVTAVSMGKERPGLPRAQTVLVR